jgi:hypothetical protein
VQTEFVAVHEEVPKEEAAVKTVRALKKQYGDRHLIVGCRQQLQKWTPGQWWVPEEVGCHPQRDESPCRSGKAKGTQSYRTDGQTEMTENLGPETVARGTLKGWMFEKRHQV